MPTSALKKIWPSLKALATEPRESIKLDALMAERVPSWQADWFIVDCLPALPVLQGAQHALKHGSVIWARVALADDLPEPARLSAVQTWLTLHNYQLVTVVEGLHPSLGEALFVRDWPALLRSDLQESVATQHQQAKAHTQAIAQALAQRDAEAQGKQEAINQRDALAAQHQQAAAARDGGRSQGRGNIPARPAGPRKSKINSKQ
ncbi:MAG: hypothetical protein IPG42_12135 [Betaproteobacteria bacterium]|nr:hypothetical protein [Betaproteobacteria bacterium]